MESRNYALTGRTVVVVGGSSGIGLATAAAAVSAGARAIITGRDQERLQKAAAELGGAVETRALDARDQQATRAAFAETGQVDHLVLAAGGSDGLGPLTELDLDQVRAGLECKALAYLGTVQAALPSLGRHGSSSITLVGARSATRASPGAAGLALINGAVEALVPTLAAELAPIRVNAVSPGIIDTPWWNVVPDAGQRSAVFGEWAKGSTVGRIGRPEEVATVILTLLANDFLSGVVIPCDGGVAA
jgi:NAD(P)-dependent dehydrogenase (short-subunit alcohol dehydrogenase family)